MHHQQKAAAFVSEMSHSSVVVDLHVQCMNGFARSSYEIYVNEAL